MHRAVLATLALAALTGCSPAPTDVGTGFDGSPSGTVVDGARLVLETYLSRDFRPVSPPDGRPLVALLRINAADSSAVPRTVRADSAWVTYGQEVWAAPVVEERLRTTGDRVYEVVAREGPKWGPEVNVDVVVRVRGADGQAVLLRAPTQPIFRID